MCAIKKHKLAALILVIVMLVGILIHSAVFWVINKAFPPLTYTTADSAVVVEMRLFLRRFAETTIGVCSTVFLVGSIMMLYSFIKTSPAVAFYKLFLLFSVTVVAMFACTVPFAIADKVFRGDYLFPVWGILAIMVLLFSILLGANLIKYLRNK
ncbi:hypothetical protein [Caproicibacter fermentans]|uniref:Uncharacterized protein n=1 Tax=Caproicibacter fermentans TaxID=2576756 RepID=A0A7G8T6V3_9FIRM|nr:hypothetical protein [Caproicibacter fermentans]QNK39344.1 hypothetical protein HCR03_11315 [Caproicibacter fermentans]